MKWEDVKQGYKNQWVVIEAVSAHSEGEKRVLDDLSIVHIAGEDSIKALSKYKELHRADKNRELYVVHTSRDKLDIKERTWIGVRGR